MTQFTHAITRKPGENFAEGITTRELDASNYQLMLRQHASYVRALESLSLEVIVLDPLPDFPDAYFVEDTAVITPEVAVITYPGARSRRGEEEAIEPILAGFRPIAHITPPGTLDGGDVLMVGRRLFVGISKRTNMAGARQLGTILEKYGYTCRPVAVRRGLHLKSSVSQVGENTLLIAEELAKAPEFEDYNKIILDKGEEPAANTLWINRSLITPADYPKTVEKLARLGFPIIELDMSEARKMDGGLSCMSLRF